MKLSGIQKATYTLIIGGVILHLRTAFWIFSNPFDSFSIGLLVWSLFPYIAIIFASRKASYGGLCAAIVVFLFDLFMYLVIFVWLRSSSAVMGLLFMPLGHVVLFIPLSFLAGYFIEKRLKKKNELTGS
jgi:apolipoprotein N-acyltransferase